MPENSQNTIPPQNGVGILPILGVIWQKLIQGVTAAFVAMAGVWLVKHPFVNILGSALWKTGVGITANLLKYSLPALAPYAATVMLAVPASIMGLSIAYALLTGTFHFHFSEQKQNSFSQYLLLNFALPCVLFSLALTFGVSMTTALCLCGAASIIAEPVAMIVQQGVALLKQKWAAFWQTEETPSEEPLQAPEGPASENQKNQENQEKEDPSDSVKKARKFNAMFDEHIAKSPSLSDLTEKLKKKAPPSQDHSSHHGHRATK